MTGRTNRNFYKPLERNHADRHLLKLPPAFISGYLHQGYPFQKCTAILLVPNGRRVVCGMQQGTGLLKG